MRAFAESVLEGRFVADVYSCAGAALAKEQVNQIGKLIKSDVAKAQLISAENVAEYMYAVSDKEQWKAADFSCLAPPFPLMFFELRRPSGVLSGRHVGLHLNRSRTSCLTAAISARRATASAKSNTLSAPPARRSSRCNDVKSPHGVIT